MVNRGKKMISCPNPISCPGNLRTLWHGNEEEAVERLREKEMKELEREKVRGYAHRSD